MEKQNSRPLVYRLTLDAMMVAVYVLFAVVLAFKAGIIEASWSSLPIFLAAFLFGLPDALIIAFVGSFLEQLLSPYGLSMTSFLWMMPVMLLALFAGCFALLLKRHPKAWLLIAAILLCEVIYTAANTVLLIAEGYIVFDSFAAFLPTLPGRLLNCVVRAALSCLLLPPLLPPLRRALHIH